MRREFFKMDVERFKAVLKLVEKDDVTVEILREPDPFENEFAQNARAFVLM